MVKKSVIVNGTKYDRIASDAQGRITLSSTQHEGTMITDLEELSTQYGVKTAAGVREALFGETPEWYGMR